jgi:hypothetical protein
VTSKRSFSDIGSQADMPRRPAHVGFTPKNGLNSDIAPCPRSPRPNCSITEGPRDTMSARSRFRRAEKILSRMLSRFVGPAVARGAFGTSAALGAAASAATHPACLRCAARAIVVLIEHREQCAGGEEDQHRRKIKARCSQEKTSESFWKSPTRPNRQIAFNCCRNSSVEMRSSQ